MIKLLQFCFALAVLVSGGKLTAQEKHLRSGLPPGSYTGASQIMQIGDDGKIVFGDNLGISHITLTENEHLTVDFPLSTNYPHFKTVFLDLTKVEPRPTWTAAYKGGTFFKVTAIPFSTEQYTFRLEVFRHRKLIAGAQQFYSFCGLKDAKETH